MYLSEGREVGRINVHRYIGYTRIITGQKVYINDRFMAGVAWEMPKLNCFDQLDFDS